MKGLRKLKIIRHIHDMECGKDERIDKDFDIIEKDLKALEIIKKYILDDEDYLDLISRNLNIPKEELDFLKEALNYERSADD